MTEVDYRFQEGKKKKLPQFPLLHSRCLCYWLVLACEMGHRYSASRTEPRLETSDDRRKWDLWQVALQRGNEGCFSPVSLFCLFQSRTKRFSKLLFAIVWVVDKGWLVNNWWNTLTSRITKRTRYLHETGVKKKMIKKKLFHCLTLNQIRFSVLKQLRYRKNSSVQ